MTETVPNTTQAQCRTCRHCRMEETTALCRVRLVQRCERDGEVQWLRMAPGVCSLLNPDNDCDRYASRRRYNLMQVLAVVLFSILYSLFVNLCCPALLWKPPMAM